MGNYKFKFRLSDMLPNAWFYKLKDMAKKPKKPQSRNPSHRSTNKQQPILHHQSQPQHRTSHHLASSSAQPHDSAFNPNVFDDRLPESPRRSSRRSSFRRRSTSKANSRQVSSSVSAGCSFRANAHSVQGKAQFSPDSSSPDSPESTFHQSIGSEILYSSRPNTSSSTSEIFVEEGPRRSSSSKIDGLNSIPELELPPILTKPAKFTDVKNRTGETSEPRRSSSGATTAHKQHRASPRCSTSSPGVRIRPTSPKIASKKIQAYTQARRSTSHRRRFSESRPIVKSSVDPQRDFRESMVEMILENNIRAPKDLEELLACYLSLNSAEYHDLIVKVFEQIWSDLVDLQYVIQD